MKLKAFAISIFSLLGLAIYSGCTTQVAIDPQTGLEQSATYTAGYFYAPLDASVAEIFRVAIREMDDMGYFRTGERHGKDSIKIYARKVGDQLVSVRIKTVTIPEAESQTELRIRIGELGNLAESQVLYARIRDGL
ncbi:MAG: DUF3568 family protein [Verrucomicrobia bacterium]|nr:DUF3568 family protein [Verrucomicrobiota bacterium]